MGQFEGWCGAAIGYRLGGRGYPLHRGGRGKLTLSAGAGVVPVARGTGADAAGAGRGGRHQLKDTRPVSSCVTCSYRGTVSVLYMHTYPWWQQAAPAQACIAYAR